MHLSLVYLEVEPVAIVSGAGIERERHYAVLSLDSAHSLYVSAMPLSVHAGICGSDIAVASDGDERCEIRVETLLAVLYAHYACVHPLRWCPNQQSIAKLFVDAQFHGIGQVVLTTAAIVATLAACESIAEQRSHHGSRNGVRPGLAWFVVSIVVLSEHGSLGFVNLTFYRQFQENTHRYANRKAFMKSIPISHRAFDADAILIRVLTGCYLNFSLGRF